MFGYSIDLFSFLENYKWSAVNNKFYYKIKWSNWFTTQKPNLQNESGWKARAYARVLTYDMRLYTKMCVIENRRQNICMHFMCMYPQYACTHTVYSKKKKEKQHCCFWNFDGWSYVITTNKCLAVNPSVKLR